MISENERETRSATRIGRVVKETTLLFPTDSGGDLTIEPGDQVFLLVYSGRVQVVDLPTPMLLFCPVCQFQHIDEDEGDIDWRTRLHRKHLCKKCGGEFKPANIYTVGVKEL